MSSKHLNSVIRLLNRKGNEKKSIKRYLSQTIDPLNPLDTINTYEVKVIKSYAGHYTEEELLSDLIRVSDIKLYINPSSLSDKPTLKDKIIDGSITYNIQSIKLWEDREIVALYIFQIRE